MIKTKLHQTASKILFRFDIDKNKNSQRKMIIYLDRKLQDTAIRAKVDLLGCVGVQDPNALPLIS